MAAPAEAATTVARPEIEKERGRGHIGLVVLGSIVGGLALGLVLVLVVFAGGREDVITGAALIALAFGMLMLFELARRRTDQPQSWALVPAIGIGVVGLALLILGPSDRVLGWLGWVWPLLLALVVIWSVRGARRSLHNWSRRALLYPAFAVLALIAVGGAFETVTEATTENNPPAGGRTYLVAGHSLYLRCTGSGSPAVILFNGLGRAHSELGLGARRCRAPDPGLCLRSRRPRLEWKGARSPGRASAFRRRARPSCGCQCSWAICSRRSLRRRHVCTRLRDGLSEGRRRGRIDRFGHAVSVRSAVVPALLLVVAPWAGATSDARAGGCRTCLLAQLLCVLAAGCPSRGAGVRLLAA